MSIVFIPQRNVIPRTGLLNVLNISYTFMEPITIIIRIFQQILKETRPYNVLNTWMNKTQLFIDFVKFIFSFFIHSYYYFCEMDECIIEIKQRRLAYWTHHHYKEKIRKKN